MRNNIKLEDENVGYVYDYWVIEKWFDDNFIRARKFRGKLVRVLHCLFKTVTKGNFNRERNNFLDIS